MKETELRMTSEGDNWAKSRRKGLLGQRATTSKGLGRAGPGGTAVEARQEAWAGSGPG